MTDATTIKNNLDRVIDDLASTPERFCNNPGVDFTRDRKITVRDVLKFPIHS